MGELGAVNSKCKALVSFYHVDSKPIEVTKIIFTSAMVSVVTV